MYTDILVFRILSRMSYEALLVIELSSLQLLPQTSSKDLRTYGLIDHPVTVMALQTMVIVTASQTIVILTALQTTRS